MSLLQKILVSLSLTLLLSFCAAAAGYFLYLTPVKRAAQHLDFVHQSIAEMHPAMLEVEAEDFRSIHARAFTQTRSLLSEVRSPRDTGALLNFYLAQYRDRHLHGGIAQSPYASIESGKSYWAGWILKATTAGYEVSYSLGGEEQPPVGARLLHCDNRPIDTFLRTHYAPYNDLRWHILNARHQAASLLTLRTPTKNVLQRPHIDDCVFQTGEGKQEAYTFRWLALSKDTLMTIRRHLYPEYQPPRLRQITEGTYWAHVSDLQLNSPTAYQDHKQLLQDLGTLEQNTIVILDTRTNSGGSSTFGQEILQALLSEENYTFIEHKLQQKLDGADALFRASWPLYWSYDYQAKQAKIHHGEASSIVTFLEELLALIKLTLEKDESFFWQSEINMGSARHKAAPAKDSNSWTDRGKIILITDKHCFSACLNFVDLAKQIPHLLHLGEPTEADTAYTQVASMWHTYYKEAYRFAVPIKKWNKRLREDNQPYLPDIPYPGDINNTEKLQAWTLQQIQ